MSSSRLLLNTFQIVLNLNNIRCVSVCFLFLSFFLSFPFLFSIIIFLCTQIRTFYHLLMCVRAFFSKNKWFGTFELAGRKARTGEYDWRQPKFEERLNERVVCVNVNVCVRSISCIETNNGDQKPKTKKIRLSSMDRKNLTWFRCLSSIFYLSTPHSTLHIHVMGNGHRPHK